MNNPPSIGDKVKILFSCGTIKKGEIGAITYCFQDGITFSVYFERSGRTICVQLNNIEKLAPEN